MCNLVEVFPTNCDHMEDFLRTLKFTYLYAKTVTLGRTHWQETNRVQLRNRRIGVSMGGIAQFITKNGIEELRVWCEKGYDEIQHYDAIYSDWLAIPKSIKTTSIKPSGSISLLAGTTHGIHYPPSRFYKRRVRLSSSSQLIKPLRLAGYRVEPQKLPVMADSRVGGVVGYSDDPTTTVIEFVVDVGAGIRSEAELSMWEQLELAALMQSWWADNQISATIKFDPRREGPQIKHALNLYQYRLKGISFLPDSDHGYVQVPQETITEEEYHRIRSGYKPLNFGSVKNESPAPERYCDNDKCEL